MLKAVEKDTNAELLQQICDILVAGGYFRARLNIEPFDKVRRKKQLSNHVYHCRSSEACAGRSPVATTISIWSSRMT